MYNAHFQFRESPFGTTPDPQFYYSNTVYREAWATLRYGIEERKGFVVITGEAGTGKTTLLRKALHEFPSSIKAVYVPTTALVGFDELLRLVLKDLGLPSSADDKLAAMERLNHYLLERFHRGEIVALLIDEAQDLSLSCLEELRLLGNLETDKHKLLQIILVGQPALEEKLNQPELLQLRQRVALRCRLRPIEPREVGLYLEARLRILGRKAADLFEPEAIERIAFYSEGFPRLINIICDNALLSAFAESRFKVSRAMIEEAAHDLVLAEPRRRTKTWPATSTGNDSRRQESSCADGFAGREQHRVSPGEGIETQTIESFGRPLQDGRRNSRLLIATSIAAGLAVVLVGLIGSQKSRSSDAGVLRDTVTLAAAGLDATNESDPIGVDLRAGKSAVAPNQQAAAPRRAGTAEIPAEPTNGQTSPAPPGRGRDRAASIGNFFVAGASFVRSKPTSSAEIIATLEPGTRITVAGRTGPYYRIRSLENDIVHGYVHEEDAFFERP